MLPKIILGLYIATTTSALIVLKLGTSIALPVSYIDHKIQFHINTYTVLGIVLYGVSFLTYIYLISKFDLGYIIPLAAAFVYIAIFIASYLIFKETFTAGKIVGIALIIGGIVFINLSK